MAQTQAPTTLLILGAHGDLTHRLLLPGLATLLDADRHRHVRVVGADRVEVSHEDWTALVADSFGLAKVPKKVADPVLRRTAYVRTDVLDANSLRQAVEAGGDGPLVIFFALPPQITMKACEILARLDLPATTRLALEKPFGTDRRSAVAFNRLLSRAVPEDNIFRIDHFLGVSTVLNLIGMRFANRVLQQVWDGEQIEKVEIVYDEDLALEGRAGYYDGAGALKDMLQSHLLQMLSIFAMESIATLDARELQEQKSQALRATRLWGGSPKRSSRRARYTAGSIGDRAIPDYAKEEGVDPARHTETLAEVTLEVVNNRWKGVPFVLRSGKALGTPRKQVVVHFRPVAHVPKGFRGETGGDRLVIDLKPGGVSFTVTMNAEGDPLDLEQKTLSATLAAPRMQPYGEVLGYILDGDQLLSVGGDAAVDCWRIMEPVITAWAADKVPLESYAAGSAGPDGWPSNADA
ncbi:Glucose-6-phosphate 1-dehydrogenase [Nostocoides japonicum T1-X7]|uniref:Glucose-6-phosphate 1-dehydrogenase n=1 Tax=Nostocoides japonicum T1-X7 TaxID=1194083 RepID=A0A077M5F1_9MICO|nr:glucose-6-phosphate dehydrogenase [Tetrasphaera japonica]CCH79290.1 Glucose-6-phosphate 1-dehydrogenase [Tetrasphaera japonica T1-X7]